MSGFGRHDGGGGFGVGAFCGGGSGGAMSGWGFVGKCSGGSREIHGGGDGRGVVIRVMVGVMIGRLGFC